MYRYVYLLHKVVNNHFFDICLYIHERGLYTDFLEKKIISLSPLKSPHIFLKPLYLVGRIKNIYYM